jgi:two-component system nitrogen regulation sensor histidine kinase NtrY
MAVDASRSEDDSSPDHPRGPGGGRARLPGGSALGAGYALAAALIGIAVWMASSAPVTGPVGPPSQAILVVLGLNLVLIGGLAFVAGGRVLHLVVAQRRDAGARLHLRFVAVFATAAVAPAIVVAIVFGVLVNQSVDSWFSHRVATVVENSATVARSYVKSQMDFIRDNVSLMAEDLNHAAPELKQNPIRFSQFLAVQASLRGFPAVYLLDRDGRVLARAEVDAPPDFLAPPPAAFAAADSGVIDA